MNWLKEFWCSWTHGGGHIKRDSQDRINWQCQKCGRWADPVLPVLRQAIEQAEQAQPVAWLTDCYEVYFDKQEAQDNSDGFIQPLYTASLQRKPLTEEHAKFVIAMRKSKGESMSDSSMIDSIADCLIEDHIDMMRERHRDEALLRQALQALEPFGSDESPEGWNAIGAIAALRERLGEMS